MGLPQPAAEIDFGYRAVHETARATKAIIEPSIAMRPAQSYFGGCSNGGRQGVTEASRYPEDFDGIISDAPGLDYTGLMLDFAWAARANTGPDGKNLLTPRSSRSSRKPFTVRATPRWAHGRSDRRSARLPVRSVHARLCEREVCGLPVVAAGRRCESAVSRPERLRRPTAPSWLPLGSDLTWAFWYTGQTSDGATTCFPRAGEGFLRTWASRRIPVRLHRRRPRPRSRSAASRGHWGRYTTSRTRISTPFVGAAASS